MARPRFLPDNFTLAIVTVVALASVLPCRGQIGTALGGITNLAIALLFFLHGAKLSREATLAGLTHWRLHLLVLTCTFVMFPVLGLALKPVLGPLVTPALYTGVLFLCTLPATVQSAIAFTSIARGNVPAAVCSASASSLLGIFLTPLVVRLTVPIDGHAPFSLDAVWRITLQLFLPFMAGQLTRRWIGIWLGGHQKIVKAVDQGSILLVVYTAFSEAVNEGLWHQLPPRALAGLFLVCCILLALALGLTAWLGRRMGFPRADRITIVFCGSKKSLASGIPMAKVLFAGHALGAAVLPLMLFHQIQLMVCAVLAQRYRAGGMPHPPGGGAADPTPASQVR